MKTLINFIYTYLFIGIIFAGKAQINQNELIYKNTILTGISEFIKTTKNENAKFMDHGYIEARVIFYDENPTKKDIILSISLKDQYYEHKITNYNIPYSYFYVDQKLVLFYIDFITFNKSNKKKKIKKIIRKIKPFLFPKEHIVAKDNTGKIIIDDKNFREEIINIHGGKILHINKNQSFQLITNEL